jgi:hypothetical protein
MLLYTQKLRRLGQGHATAIRDFEKGQLFSAWQSEPLSVGGAQGPHVSAQLLHRRRHGTVGGEKEQEQFICAS